MYIYVVHTMYTYICMRNQIPKKQFCRVHQSAWNPFALDNSFPEREYSFGLFSFVGFGYLGYAGNKFQAIFSSNLNELVNKLHPV